MKTLPYYMQAIPWWNGQIIEYFPIHHFEFYLSSRSLAKGITRRTTSNHLRNTPFWSHQGCEKTRIKVILGAVSGTLANRATGDQHKAPISDRTVEGFPGFDSRVIRKIVQHHREA